MKTKKEMMEVAGALLKIIKAMENNFGTLIIQSEAGRDVGGTQWGVELKDGTSGTEVDSWDEIKGTRANVLIQRGQLAPQLETAFKLTCSAFARSARELEEELEDENSDW